MTQFDDTCRQLHQTRQQQENTRLNLFVAREQLAKNQRSQQRLDRYFNPQNPQHQARQRRLQAQQAKTEATISQLESGLGESVRMAERLTAEFLPFTDPRDNLRFKSTDYPVLLFPLRLETRFKSVEVPGATQVEQLWVRVYPDECLVDTFEAVLSESELVSVQKFWVDWAKAGGEEAEQRGAWRSLVAGFGAGRAAWLIQQYRPDLGTPFPQKTDFDVVLVISTESPLPPEEKPAVEAFWIAWWRAAGDAAAEQTAVETLAAAIGIEQAAVMRTDYVPANLADEPPSPLTRPQARVAVAWLEFPDQEQMATQQQPWSQPPRVTVLPERLVLLGYRRGERVLEQLGNPISMPLIAGPDPLADEADQLRLENGDVVVSDAMRWMVDFDRAVEVGMGFRVDLSPEDLNLGFDQLLVLGVRLSADASAGQEMLETLFQHHETGNSGFSLVPQGTPTNNTEGAGSGFSEREDADDTYDLVFKPDPLTHDPDLRSRRDGQWLADLLGIRLNTFDRTPCARGRDQCEARAMNTVLWPGTWGYLMESMMAPVFDASTIEKTRWFFTNFVSARGILPAIRIGDQPYGILPTTVFSRVVWLRERRWPRPLGVPHPEGYRNYLIELHQLLETMRVDWQQQLSKVSYVGKGEESEESDPHQILLDVVGLHPSSVEYYQRYAESLEQLTNRLKLQGAWGHLLVALIALGYPQSGMDLLTRLGYEDTAIPEILEKFFLKQPDKLLGDLIDDQPLSEMNPIRAYTEDGRNYIRWLIDTAQTSFDALRKEEGFAQKPRALLYLMLRYALEQGYWDAGLRLFQTFELLSPAQLATARLDPSFVHVADRAFESSLEPTPNPLATSGKPVRLNQRSKSRYEYLYQTAPTITNNPDLVVADYIPQVISQLPATRYLYQQLEALKHLENTPTARLERLLAEHVDLCTYRLDAWRWGLLNYQLLGMRYGNRPTPPSTPSPPDDGSDDDIDDDIDVERLAVAGDRSPARQGLYLGAFGIVERVKSENKRLTPVKSDELGEELDTIFNPPEAEDLPPLMRDNTNGGFIHAPSLNHAIAAAILRNGYIANATPGNPDLLKVNLSSERVRLALGIIEGIRNGQTLGALLGYQLERGLHDRHPEAEVDQFIFELRKAFPLVADRFRETRSEETDAIQAIEARNVINGYALVNQIKQSNIETYPFGKGSLPTTDITDEQKAVINTEVDRILDVHDAVADLVMAEGVYQAVQGNYGRVASNLDAYAKGTFPPEPEVVQTPRSGINLTHRMGLHFESGLNPAISPNALAITPRTHAEPAVNAWLNRLLPDPATVICKATYLNAANSTLTTDEVSQQQLGLQPLDLLYLVNPETNQAMTELDDQVVYHVLTTHNPRWDGDIQIQYVLKEPGRISFFEVGAMLGSLRSLILKSRPLNAADVALPTETRQETAEQVLLNENRLTPLVTQLGELVSHPNPGTDDLDALIADLDLWLPDPETHRSNILGAIDNWIDRVMALFVQAMKFSIPQAGIGFTYDWKKQQFGILRGKVDELVERWQDRLDRFNTLLTTDYPAATTDEERISLLRQAEGLVSTELTVPLPAIPEEYRMAAQAKGATFEAELNQLRAIQTSSNTALSQLLTDINARLPLDAFDYQKLEVAAVEEEILRFAGDLYDRMTLLRTELLRRQTTANDQISAALSLGAAPARVEGLTQAARTLLGEDFKIIPEFSLSEDQASEWNKAWGDRTLILSYLTDPEPAGVGLDFPVDEWLYGVARVREDAAHWERVMMLSRAFGTGEPELIPIQLPYREHDRWLAMPYPPDYEFEGDRLLYTAHYAIPFNPGANQCGLLLDEWTEVISTPEETTGITFNYDRPNAEPPQTMLLVASPHMDGAWQWNDLVDAIRETIEEARLRAVEPTQVDDTAYARFLPATISAVTFHPLTIMLNLALNNNVYRLINTEEDA
ncbi:hypothetical protein XM38_028410 [Halomicronema hongdechloris C2206]|uniref:Uncharacterized protein n=1 Tax=Halomicronema hongdechloris C2206 TaxID=1641165 RepID=A0A1Z3HNZ7_9CYAN|nr:hypothetical protein [Halomicronema hongdechloris]ASC71887.1 hypothetical protein XM38_028410 [Halomicronema hongdechloris C2206]